jgi:hypothetical protein
MRTSGRGVDFVTIDGGEGGTGAAPLVFTDHVALPFRAGFAEVYTRFAEAGLADDVVFIGAGRLGLPGNALVAFALGADLVNVGREAMLSIGCIQAQRCHTGRCPTGVATQSRWLMRGLDPELKSARAANYVRALRGEMLALSRACGVPHPGLVTPEHLEIVTDRFRCTSVGDVFGYDPAWRRLSPEREAELRSLIGAGGSGVGSTTDQGGPIAGDDAGRSEDRDVELASVDGDSGLASGGD